MKFIVEVDVDTKAARTMLGVAGYYNIAYNKKISEEEIAKHAIKQNETYAVKNLKITHIDDKG